MGLVFLNEVEDSSVAALSNAQYLHTVFLDECHHQVHKASSCDVRFLLEFILIGFLHPVVDQPPRPEELKHSHKSSNFLSIVGHQQIQIHYYTFSLQKGFIQHPIFADLSVIIVSDEECFPLLVAAAVPKNCIEDVILEEIGKMVTEPLPAEERFWRLLHLI